jgi:hypothetical protein
MGNGKGKKAKKFKLLALVASCYTLHWALSWMELELLCSIGGGMKNREKTLCQSLLIVRHFIPFAILFQILAYFWHFVFLTRWFWTDRLIWNPSFCSSKSCWKGSKGIGKQCWFLCSRTTNFSVSFILIFSSVNSPLMVRLSCTLKLTLFTLHIVCWNKLSNCVQFEDYSTIQYICVAIGAYVMLYLESICDMISL